MAQEGLIFGMPRAGGFTCWNIFSLRPLRSLHPLRSRSQFSICAHLSQIPNLAFFPSSRFLRSLLSSEEYVFLILSTLYLLI